MLDALRGDNQVERRIHERQRAGVGVHAIGGHLPPRLVEQLQRDVERRYPRAAPLRLAAEPPAATADIEHRQAREVVGAKQLSEDDFEPPPQVVRVDQLVKASRYGVVEIELPIAGGHSLEDGSHYPTLI